MASRLHSDSESEEENLASQKTSCDDGERRKPQKRNAGTTTKTSQPRKKIKVSNTALDNKKIQEVAAWIFSSEEAKKVEQHMRSTLFKGPRVNCQTFVERHRRAKLPTVSGGILSQVFYVGTGILRE